MTPRSLRESGWRWPLVLGAFSVVAPAASRAQPAPVPLGSTCTVQIGNRPVRIQPDGSWELNGIPATGARQRARIVCESPTETRTGFSELTALSPNLTSLFTPIPFNGDATGPTGITVSGVSADVNTLTPRQLSVVGVFPGGATQDLTAGSTGTDYTISDATVATLSADGLLTPLRSGSVMITAVNEAVSGSLLVRMVLSGDSDGDGIPDDWERAHGLDPNDPTDALTDSDADNLINRDEYLHGTDPFKRDSDDDGIDDQEELIMGSDGVITNPLLKDSDGDLIPDALELLVGTNPVDANSYSLDLSVTELRVTPNPITLLTNILLTQATVQLKVVGVLLDGSGIDLTGHSATVYRSLDTAVVDMSPIRGQVIAYGAGNTSILVTLTSTHFAKSVPVTSQTSNPAVLGYLDLANGCFPGELNIRDNTAYVACNLARLDIVSLPPRSGFALVGTLPISGATDVETVPGYAFVSHSTGMSVVNVSAPSAPVVVTTLPIAGGATRLALDGNTLVLIGSGGLHVVDVSVPTAPALRSSTASLGGALFVDVRGALVALGGPARSVRLVDVTDPVNPVLRSTATLADNDSGVAFSSTGLVTAVGVSGLQLVDVANPASPVVKAPFGSTSFKLFDVDAVDEFAFGADIFRVNSLPIINVLNLNAPVYAFDLDFRQFGDPNAYAVAADRLHAGMLAGGRLYAGIWGARNDTAGIPPTCDWIDPQASDAFIEGMPLTLEVFATDDVQVAGVRFNLDGQPLGLASSGPFQHPWVVPGADSAIHTLTAVAFDLAGNERACPTLPIRYEADPKTTVQGTVVNSSMVPLQGATIALSPSGNGTSLANGTFSIPNVPTYTMLRMVVRATITGALYQKVLLGVPPVPAGVTNVGTVVMDTRASYPSTMGPIVAESVTLDALPALAAAPPTRMGPVVAASVTLDALPGLTASLPTRMGPVVASSLTVDAFVGLASSPPAFMGPVVAASVTSDAFLGLAATPPASMGPVVAPSVTVDGFLTVGAAANQGPVVAPTWTYDTQ